MLMTRKRMLPLLSAISFVLYLLAYHDYQSTTLYTRWLLSIESQTTKPPTNTTLGFGAVVVVSNNHSPRRHSLIQAANVTELDLSVPKQPDWTENDISKFINGQDNVQRGSILAWLGHHNALRWFLDSGVETALILEDDVDWDIRLKSVQIPLAASAVRRLLPPEHEAHPWSLQRPSNRLAQYWGNHNNWDVLYLGHCGDYFGELDGNGPRADRYSFNLTGVQHAVYHDPTLPARPDLHPFTQRLFSLLFLPLHSRVLHRSQFPLCTFGYALTRSAATRLLTDLAPAQYRKDGPRAYDVALLNACQKDRNAVSFLGLRCWTLNSELFHHMPGRSQIDSIGRESGERPGVPPVDRAAQAQIVQRNETTNIDCGFWSGAFAFGDGDVERLGYLREMVGRQGRCLKEGR